MLRFVPLRTLGRLLAVTLPFYFAWEMLQAPFFTGMPTHWLAATAICALATLGDGVLVALVATAGAVLHRNGRWFVPPSPSPYAVVVAIGLVLQIAVEWVMVHGLDRWGYAPSQPVLPGVRVGILPVLQPIVLLPMVFWFTAKWEGA
ncbi:MAG: hypothetical protein ACREM3_10690 [Candidatus Rokuibacteriota bacterium]